MVIAGGAQDNNDLCDEVAASTEPAMVIAGGVLDFRRWVLYPTWLQRSRRW